MPRPLPKLILASASPRRRALLEAAGYQIEVVPSHIDEPEPSGPVDVRAYVADLAQRKALAVGLGRATGLVLAADTACAIAGHILNKPRDRDDAERMIRMQEDRETEVWTAIVLYSAERRTWLGTIECSVVFVRRLSDAERNVYLDSGQWRGKAGGYGVQDDDPFVRVITGSFSNVVGLPMERLNALLAQFAAGQW